MTDIVLDSETTTRNKGEGSVGSFGASPFYKDNYVVSIGELILDEDMYIDDYVSHGLQALPESLRRAAAGQLVTIIMHNAGFDIAYMIKTYGDAFW